MTLPAQTELVLDPEHVPQVKHETKHVLNSGITEHIYELNLNFFTPE